MNTQADLAAISRRIRARLVEMSHVAETPHLGSSLSCVDMLVAAWPLERMKRSRFGSRGLAGSIRSAPQYAATRISTHESADPRCGALATLDISTTRPRIRRARAFRSSRSAVGTNPGFINRVRFFDAQGKVESCYSL